ncbi:MAG: HXXEE domain-containing protein [Prevotella sp.]|nr:HXXEE domain-containing protein [Prevotella sp.]
MQKLECLMLLLPLVFMIHEYEEVIMFRYWLARNREELKRRFPKIERWMAFHGLFGYSTATFAVGTAHEFLLIAVVTFLSVWQEAYQWWFAAFMGYTLHLIVHLVQWVIYRKYVPVVITSLLTFPYCIYALVAFAESSVLSSLQMLLWTMVGLLLTVLSLFSAFFLMSMFQRWQERS